MNLFKKLSSIAMVALLTLITSCSDENEENITTDADNQEITLLEAAEQGLIDFDLNAWDHDPESKERLTTFLASEPYKELTPEEKIALSDENLNQPIIAKNRIQVEQGSRTYRFLESLVTDVLYNTSTYDASVQRSELANIRNAIRNSSIPTDHKSGMLRIITDRINASYNYAGTVSAIAKNSNEQLFSDIAKDDCNERRQRECVFNVATAIAIVLIGVTYAIDSASHLMRNVRLRNRSELEDSLTACSAASLNPQIPITRSNHITEEQVNRMQAIRSGLRSLLALIASAKFWNDVYNCGDDCWRDDSGDLKVLAVKP